MLSIAEAQQQIALAAIAITEQENVPLHKAHKRILAQDRLALVDAPPADNSAMDGYAIKAPAYAPPWQFSVSQTVNAGQSPQPLVPGTAARIFTGANIPEGADTVVIQENCEAHDTHISIRQAPPKGANIRPRGQDFVHGQVLVRRGQRLDATKLALLAAGGMSSVPVVRPPRVALISTGSELVEPGKPLQSGQIYNSNTTLLASLLTDWGCTISQPQHIVDNLEQTKVALRNLAGSVDLIVTSGGVSVGDEDHVKAAVAALGTIELWKICLKPGKPLAFGFINNKMSKAQTPVIGLPGNPVSSFVTAVLFVKAFINGLYGRTQEPLPALHAPATFAIDGPQTRPEFIRVQLRNDGLATYPNQSSGVLSSLSWADALALIEPERLPIKHGDPLPYYPLLQLMELG